MNCFSGWHIPLATIALLSLLSLALLILLVAAALLFDILRKKVAIGVCSAIIYNTDS